MTDVTAPRRRITRERRQRPFVAGIVGAVAGLVMVIAGAVVVNVNQGVGVLAAAARAEVPDPMTFDAEARTYAVVLLPHPLTEPGFDPVAELACDVALADGTTSTLRGSRPAVTLSGSAGTSVGSFDAVRGETTVTCRFDGRPDTAGLFVSVAPEREGIAVAGYGLLAVGLAVIAAGVVAIVVGVRGRTVVTTSA